MKALRLIHSKWRNWRARRSKLAAILVGLSFFVLLALVLDHLFPLPMPGRNSAGAALVVAADGTPLRAFPDRDHVWRNPVSLDQVSPRYIDALLHYEDRTFWWNPGINLFSMFRSGWQWLRYGHVVSGGSTLTMQVARIIDPMPHTVSGKLRQILRALQLEYHYSKRDILQIYLNYAPMGGIVEGVEAASRAYLGKSSAHMSAAEAAMLTVLPQAPTLLRPDRFPERTRRARDKVIRRMQGLWSPATQQDALTEPISVLPVHEPLLAPLLAERVRRIRSHQALIKTFIDPQIQSVLEQILANQTNSLPHAMSMAAMIMDNRSLAVLGYAGTAEFANTERNGFIDMIQAERSPGSTLKPFLYGFALDDSLVHSESLMVDVPQSFKGYSPENFEDSFHGPVSVSQALVQSLNVPAVDLLDRLGPANFFSRLRQGGLHLQLPKHAQANLSIILGGGATTLEDLVGAYRALAHHGLAGTPRLLPDEPRKERRMMSEGAAFIIRDILTTGGDDTQSRGEIPGVAWKTGTSFGYRDAWSIGINKQYTVGVWIGRPDGTPSPGFYGASIAQPLLMQIFASLPRSAYHAIPPHNVTRATICWPLGRRETDDEPSFCQVRRSAWLLNGAAPPTLPDRLSDVPLITHYTTDNRTGLRVDAQCGQHKTTQRESPHWPLALEPWLSPSLMQQSRLPEWSPDCHMANGGRLSIDGGQEGEILVGHQQTVTLRLRAQGAETRVHWLLNGKQIAVSSQNDTQIISLSTPGYQDITAMDEVGHYDHIRVNVYEKQSR